MNSKQVKWTSTFLTAIAIAVSYELFAAFDNNPDSLTLTHLTTTYIPSWIGLPLIVVFAGWLVLHFKKYYSE